jgi:CRISPR/Cas system-associated protein Cas10 (large subunit of type III CRISPR-Cas system)
MDAAAKLNLSKGIFKLGEVLGASTLIKRLWWHSHLVKEEVLGIKAEQMRKHHPMPNTRSVAAGDPYDSDGEFDEPEDDSEKYFAILALDGDEMGKWISGSKTTADLQGTGKSAAIKNRDALSLKAGAFYQQHAPEFLDAPRILNPSWHLQFSEALGNFSFHAVQRVIEAFDGRLIYAGGDDVLAMLPAKDALPCAHALRQAFRGEKSLNDVLGKKSGNGMAQKSDRVSKIFNIEHAGYLQLDGNRKPGGLLSDPTTFPLVVPGPNTDVSVGIAIAHFKAPLQDVVRAAQAAEKRAKRAIDQGGYGRGAFALSLFKRSGEILEWGAKWNSSGHQALIMLSAELNQKKLNGRFPHKLEALLTPYLPQQKSSLPENFSAIFLGILEKELDHCLSRNEGGTLDVSQRQILLDYWTSHAMAHATEPVLHFSHSLRQFINLLRTAAWLQR